MTQTVGNAPTEILEQLSAFARNSQIEAVFASNLHLANWFQALNKVVRQEIRRRAGEERDEPDQPDALLDQRTREMTDEELEAVGMGFAMIASREGASIADEMQAALDAAYDPVRREYLRRTVAIGGAENA